MGHVLTRPEMYCVVPPDLADELLVPLRAHFADQGVKVIEERRDPRKAVSLEIRRQRAMHLPRALHDLPAPLARHDERLRLVQRMPSPGLVWADTALLEVVAAVQDGDGVAASELVWRISARVADRLVFHRGQRGTNLLEQALGRILDELHDFDGHEETEFLLWVDDVVDALR